MEQHVYPPSKEIVDNALIKEDQYKAMYAESIADPEAFWGEQGKRLDWITPYTKVKNTTFEYPDVSVKWFEDGVLNVSANCVDRHLEDRADQVAIIWEGDNPEDDAHITYKELHEHVSRLANVYKKTGRR